VAALQLSTVSPSDDDDDDVYDDDDRGEFAGGRKSRGGDARRGKREVDEAFRLFLGGPGGEDREEVITLGALRRVARDLKEDVTDAVLRDMILEANGGAGVGKGVRKAEFEGVMRRAGAFR
jgi:hypothetical protein